MREREERRGREGKSEGEIEGVRKEIGETEKEREEEERE